MDLQKLKPWNWFKREEAAKPEVLPARREAGVTLDPIARAHQEMDRLFETFLGPNSQLRGGIAADVWLKPSVDIAETRNGYRVSVEVPGITEDEIDLAIDGDELVISGEKRQQSEDDDKGYHRVECAYGQFRRILSLPDDADADNISAKFRNGVLKVEIPRRGDLERSPVRRIQINR